MKSVVFSGSIRNYESMSPWADYLHHQGVIVDLPLLSIAIQDFDKLSIDRQRQQKLAFIDDHNRRIDAADVLFVFNPDSHVGNSVTMEIGYALAKGKEIYAVNPDSELGRDVVYLGYCATPEELLSKLA